ncbi:hypothetical protein F4819DRAFT_482839 [Hypoxylon fuscum]|nr:hypothetical protein F4819DRAFT_482839 [Hypoxylon fuscum]
MALPFPHPSALLPPGLTMSRCTPADVSGMTSACLTRNFAFISSLAISRREKSYLHSTVDQSLLSPLVTSVALAWNTIMKAFPAGSAFTYWWSPSLDVMKKWHDDRIRGRFADPHTQQFKVVDETTGAVVAFAKWDPPATMKGLRGGFVTYDEHGEVAKQQAGEGRGGGEGGAEGKAKVMTQKLQAPEGSKEGLYEDFFARLKKMGEKWQTDEKLVLSIICTDPAYHGRGVGSGLIQSVLDVADAEGITTYLEALPLAVPLYRRHGFVPVDRLEYDLTKAGMEGTAVLTIMVREPKATA